MDKDVLYFLKSQIGEEIDEQQVDQRWDSTLPELNMLESTLNLSLGSICFSKV